MELLSSNKTQLPTATILLVWNTGPDGGCGAKGSCLDRARSRRPIQAAVQPCDVAGPNALKGGTTPREHQGAACELMIRAAKLIIY